MLKTVMLLNIFSENHDMFFFKDFLMNRKFKRIAFIWNGYFCSVRNVFIVTFNEFAGPKLVYIIISRLFLPFCLFITIYI